MADARLVVGVVAAPEPYPFAQQVGLLVAVLGRADEEQRVGTAVLLVLADRFELVGDLLVRLVPGDPVPLAALKLHRGLETVRVVSHAVLADRGALRAVRAEVDRGIEHRFLAYPHPLLHDGVAGAAHRAVRADRALDLGRASGLVLRLRGADHAVGQLRGHRRGARAHARAL